MFRQHPTSLNKLGRGVDTIFITEEALKNVQAPDFVIKV
jgi:hypothetical protein